MSNLISSGTRQHVQRAVVEWREDAAGHEDNMTFFYYGGFGVGTHQNDVLFLLEDFGDPKLPLLQNVLSFDNLFHGMSVSIAKPSMARTQLFFVDTNRFVPETLIPYGPASRFFDPEFGRRDDRTAPIFYAAVPGSPAYAKIGEGSFFVDALLSGLNGDAAEPTGGYRGDESLWHVSVNSLAKHLEGYFDRLAQEGPFTLQACGLSGLFRDTTIVYLDQAPAGRMLVLNREWGVDEPGLHALIVGVSAYLHLPGGASKRTRDTLGMQQLSSAALSAYRIYQWLLEYRNCFPVPLASIRLILSPSRAERESEHELKDFDPCTLNKFLAAATLWRKDAARNKDNLTIFYYAGHGAQRIKGDTVLFMEDFGDEYGGLLKNAVDLHNLFEGMAPSSDYVAIARTQLYFVDTCRVRPEEFKRFDMMYTTQVFDVETDARDYRMAPIFSAAVPGDYAYGRIGELSLFGEALLKCLKETAVVVDRDTDQKQVTVSSLSQALSEYVGQQEPRQEFAMEGRWTGNSNVVVCSWKGGSPAR